MRPNLWIDELAELVPPATLFREQVDLLSFTRDTSPVPAGEPEVAVRPSDADGVAEVLRFAKRRAVPVYVRGAGSMYAGGAVPHKGGIVLDMTALDGIVDIDIRRGLVVVEPAVRFGALLKALKPLGYTIGIVPLTGAAGTVGGAVSAHALGTGSPKFQSMGDQIAGLEVVLADGARVRTGSAASRQAGFFQRYCIGPDLTGLFLGADSTMGVITKIALWLHRLPEHVETLCLGFPDSPSGAAFLSAMQGAELTRNTWYGAIYEEGAIVGRVGAARPDIPRETLPAVCVALDLGGEAPDVDRDRDRLVALARDHGGDRFDVFDEVFFRSMRRDHTLWYSFAGYFTRSRCSLLMASLPCETLPALFDRVKEWRAKYTEYVWGTGIVLCRRGVHGAVIAFYDEESQWDAVQPVFVDVMNEMTAMGCVPYKPGKIWADAIRSYPEYFDLLGRIKKTLDPDGTLGPGNLGL